MELKDLVGMHTLSGVDFDERSIEQWPGSFEDSQVVNFVLDGKTYTAVEDPNDGYRSSMKEIAITDFPVKNVFPGIAVFCVMHPDGNYNKNDVLDVYDAKNGKLVLAIGTEDWDDYYPTFKAEFTPENMSINDQTQEAKP